MRCCRPILLVALLLAGCTAPKAQMASQPAPAERYDTAVAAALIIEPAMVADAPPIDLDRDVRGPGAYAGFEDTVYTYYYLYQSDSQIGYGPGWGWRSGGGRCGASYDRFERTAVTQRIGVSYR